ncbi:MAG: NAD(P)-dependent oxidoreductase [Proteobacteria bacterium]|nr:NAD(P)-dependent oxidoreductase [Pseudomonadota bacterium]
MLRIAGVNGYIGAKIALDFLQKGNKIIGLDSRYENVSSLANNPHFQFFKTDITNATTLPDEVREADILVHCAALVHKQSSDLSRENYFRVNCEGTKNILNFLDKGRLKQIIFLSTVSVYGDISNNVAPDENTPTNPEDFYGESKLAAENAIRGFSEKYHIPYTIFRLVPVYGDLFLLNINKRIYLPGKIAFYKIGAGRQCLSLVSVNNVVDIVAACINNPLFFNETFIVKDVEDYSINGIIATFKDMYSQRGKPVVRIPLCIPETAFKLLGLVMPEKAKFYEYQLKKIAKDAVYSGGKLRSRVQLKWNIKNTLKQLSR